MAPKLDAGPRLFFSLPLCICLPGLHGTRGPWPAEGPARHTLSCKQMVCPTRLAPRCPPSFLTAGSTYVEVLEYSTYIDDSVTAYDALEGFIAATATYQLCAIPDDLQAVLQQGLDSWDDDWSSGLDLSSLECFKSNVSLNTFRAGSLAQGHACVCGRGGAPPPGTD